MVSETEACRKELPKLTTGKFPGCGPLIYEEFAISGKKTCNKFKM